MLPEGMPGAALSRRYLLDPVNIVPALIRDPQGPIASPIARVGETEAMTSIVAAAEIRCGAVKRGSIRPSSQVEAMPGALAVGPFESPADRMHGGLRAELERTGRLIGAHDLLIAAQAPALGRILVTGNGRESARVPNLDIENGLRDGIGAKP